MVRWRLTFCLLLGMLLVVTTKATSKADDDDEDDKHPDEEIDDEDDDDEDDDEEVPEKIEKPRSDVGKRAPAMRAPPPEPASEIKKPSRVVKKKPLECYVCAYKAETPLKACLDPSKYRVHTITCHNLNDKCFTSVISKGNNYEAVVRGCRTGCIGSPETTCCELNRCNNQVYAMPIVERSVMADGGDARTTDAAAPTVTPTVFFFVTILLILQTVVKVAIV